MKIIPCISIEEHAETKSYAIYICDVTLVNNYADALILK